MLMQLDIAGHVMHLVTSAPVLVDISVLDVPSQDYLMKESVY